VGVGLGVGVGFVGLEVFELFGEVVDIFDVDVGLVDEVALPEAVAADDFGAGCESCIGQGQGAC